jgi:hypothetical protein
MVDHNLNPNLKTKTRPMHTGVPSNMVQAVVQKFHVVVEV